MQIALENIQYHPGRTSVALLMKPPQPFAPFFLTTTQEALSARANGEVWGDAEALAEAQALMDTQYPGQGFTAVLP